MAGTKEEKEEATSDLVATEALYFNVGKGEQCIEAGESAADVPPKSLGWLQEQGKVVTEDEYGVLLEVQEFVDAVEAEAAAEAEAPEVVPDEEVPTEEPVPTEVEEVPVVEEVPAEEVVEVEEPPVQEEG